MTEEERIKFEANGLLKLEGALPPATLASVRKAAAEAEAVWRADPSRPGMRGPNREDINAFIEYNDTLLNLLWYEPVVGKVREMLGDDLMMLDNDYFMGLPGKPSIVGWHPDVGVRGIYHPRSTVMVKTFTLLSDVDEKSGATYAIPGSHRFPMDWKFPKVQEPEDMPGWVPFSGKAGDVWVFNGRCYHSASHHRGDRRREVLIVNYGHSWMKVFDGYEPSTAVKAKADGMMKRQILGMGKSWGHTVPADASFDELLKPSDRFPGDGYK
jgi:ectoine hydroxylase-related dioxygenase (phytanoyl-CoA dioxygenase family)